VKAGIDRVEKLRNDGFHLLGYMRYNLEKPNGKGMPLVYFEAYENVSAQPRDNTLKMKDTGSPRSDGEPVGTCLCPLITKNEYVNMIAFIKEQILNGITYEVNYTYPSVLKTNLSDTELYGYLLPRQTTPYNAFIRNRYETLMSFSPELFFRIKGRHILTKPMKGTIRRGSTAEEDAANRKFLAEDENQHHWDQRQH